MTILDGNYFLLIKMLWIFINLTYIGQEDYLYLIKIANLATSHDLITIPHGHSSNAILHFSLSQVPIHTPFQNLIKKE